MKKHMILCTAAALAIALFTSESLQAQSKELTLKDAVLKAYPDFYPKRLAQLQWVKNMDAISYVDDSEDVQGLMLRKADEGDAKMILTLAQLNAMEGMDTELKRFPTINWTDSSAFSFSANNNYYQVLLDVPKVEKLFSIPENAEELSFNHDMGACAYVLDHNLYILDRQKFTHKVTDDGKPGIVYGKAVHRNEFGINSGIFWSPDGSKLAYYRMDEQMVSDYPIVDINERPASVNLIKYPMAGSASHHVTLHVFDPGTGKSVAMKTGEPAEQYLCTVTWSPAGDAIYISLLNREQNALTLNRYNAKTGKLEHSLFEEKDEKYVEPEHPLYFLPHDPEKFIWMSERTGFEHMYLYNTKGELINPLTTGDWEVEEILGFDPSGRYLFVAGTGEPRLSVDATDNSKNALHRYTYKVDTELAGANILDERPGTHRPALSSSGNYILEHYTSVQTPWESNLFRSSGEQLAVVHKAKDPLAEYGFADPEIGSILAGDGSLLYTRIIKPGDFDPDKKYPLLLYVYGGPHAQLITDSYLAGAPLWMYWMAEQGYIVATCDNRGSANRGLEFEQGTFRQLGMIEMTDQKQFVDELAALPYVDEQRMAIHGWSYGGFMTINMMTTFPDLFKAGVAGGPVIDWAMYEVMYTERYMDTPQENPEGYDQANLIKKAAQLKNKLLVIHGTSDDVVLWQHSQAFLKACIENEVQLDYFVYPGHKHNVMGKDRYHLIEKVLNYIDEQIGQP